MAAPVEARVAAVRSLADGLTTYQRGLEAALAGARSDLNHAQADFQQRTARCQTAFERASREAQARKADLDRCAKNCGGLAQAYANAVVLRDQCERRWQKHRQALTKIEGAATELRSSMRTIEASSSEAIPRGRKYVQDYASILDQYLHRGAG
jgi:chromosome segregation ATPase